MPEVNTPGDLLADVLEATNQVNQAVWDLQRISLLPVALGARVRWGNGVVWTRVGGNAWVPDNGAPPVAGETWPSLHVASYNGWEVL